MTPNDARETAQATFAGGCFWCTEAVFKPIDGVLRVVSGYTGGHTPNPTYAEVCDETTGHAEAVQITFDPAVITYGDLLEIFFASHDPTTKDRQGNDVGTQYRSAVFVHDEAQRSEAERVIAQLTDDDVFGAPIVTELAELDTFHQAEAYHQNFYANNTGYGYCKVVINPKLAKIRARFAHRLRTAPRA
ncbi:MAG: peptide-methionine (S)-S-oxide reductase MsrA [Trueperaceae bacterium]|nr:peptide-methionine (S)-S-oxide reductase MsrA [Trueperaceae bacterium]